MPVSGVLEQFLTYWHSLPRENGSVALPVRSSLKPSHLHDRLPRLALLKRLDRYNVTATMICTEYDTQWLGPTVGMNAFDLTPANMRENTAELYGAILDQPAAALIRETVHRKGGKKADVASLYLPLANKKGAATYIVGCTVYENRPAYGTINDRLILDHQRVRNIEFIDIGAGLPIYSFKKPTKPTPHLSTEGRWWNRFIPAKSRAGSSNFEARTPH